MGNKLQFVPLLVFLMFPASFITTYSIGVSYGHIRPFFSYISDTGTISPESCWFALFLFLTSVVLGFVVFIRYKQVEVYLDQINASGALKKFNTFSMGVGFISALGASVVGAFQETNVLSVHILGAFMAFLGGAFYLTFQAIFTFKMLPMFCNRCIAYMRLIIGISCIALFTITYTCGVLAVQKFKGDDFVYWEPEDGGWTLRVISVSSEWLMASLFDLYLLSFMLDFKKINFKPAQFTLLQDNNGEINGNTTKKYVNVRYNETDIDKE